MAETKWTPGPWRVASRRELANDPEYIVLGAGNTGACIIGRYEGMETDTRWANAALIAAAPDLYVTLAHVSAELKLDRDYALYDEGMRALVRRIDVALAKAHANEITKTTDTGAA